ncbi:hypothetical protein [Qipengyuania sediminis]|uniref:hypothetical protein n=1 Tax=Qipengyuania sediminis TaxID=1532023 RepID=UPI0010595E3B|nr:hypothetical protein [Qipengyuania sediminis]
MSDPRQQVIEDRRLRDASRAVLDADWAHVRADYKAKGMGARALARISAGASDVFEEARDVAADNKGALAAIVAALALWFARHPILDAVLGDERDG